MLDTLGDESQKVVVDTSKKRCPTNRTLEQIQEENQLCKAPQTAVNAVSGGGSQENAAKVDFVRSTPYPSQQISERKRDVTDTGSSCTQRAE